MIERAALDALSDEELAARTADGGGACFDVLVTRYGRRLYRYLRPKTGSDQETEDLIQETFRKAFQNIGRFDPSYRFSTWVFTIAGRLAVSFFRARRPHVEPVETEARDPGPEERLIERQERDNIWAKARTLRPRQYEALWLRYAEDQSVREIARIMKTSSAHVRVLLHRGRMNLAKALRSAEPEGEPASPRKLTVL